MLDEPFTETEAARVMENLPVAKQPGPNRIPSGLFKRMTKTFAKKIADMINESSRTGILPKHFLEGDTQYIDAIQKRRPRGSAQLPTDYVT